MQQYWKTRGNKNDYQQMDDSWGSAGPNDERNPVHYLKKEPKAFGKENMMIIEPCNYVSNVAYYHSTTEICSYKWGSFNTEQKIAAKRAFSMLTFGSSFWHGSHTNAGGIIDDNMIWLIGNLAYESAV